MMHHKDGNTVTIPLEFGVESVEVIGTHVIPEFGTIAAIVILVVAITCNNCNNC